MAWTRSQRGLARCSPRSIRSAAVEAVVAGLRLELRLTPKPGLVDLCDSGSHADLSLEVMDRSIGLVGAYLEELERSVERGEGLEGQVRIGRRAEDRMRDELGANTHKGAIFLGGLVVVAGMRGSREDERALRAAISSAAAEVIGRGPPRGTHGDAARSRFGVRGILGEALRGLPSVFDVALPAFRSAMERGVDAERAAFAMLAVLMKTVEDTTALHRCGERGLSVLREDGARLERLVRGGGHVPYLRERNAFYRRMNLTMGGVADLLGVALGRLVATGEMLPAAW